MQLKTIIIRNIHSYIFNDLHFLIDDFITLYYDSAFAGSSHWGHFLAQFQIDYLFMYIFAQSWQHEQRRRCCQLQYVRAPETIMRPGFIEKNNHGSVTEPMYVLSNTEINIGGDSSTKSQRSAEHLNGRTPFFKSCS